MRHPERFAFTTLLLLFVYLENAFGQQGLVLQEFIFEKAPFRECHASTIAETPEGLVSAWFGGTKEKNKDVEIWISRKVNGVWTAPVSVANGVQSADLRYPCWNPVLYQVPGGPLQLYYKVGPDPRSWWGMLQGSDDHGQNWHQPVRLPDGIMGPIKNKPVLLHDGTLISPVSTEDNGWQIHFEYSTDFGKHWSGGTPINDASSFNAIQPTLLTYPGQRLQLLARSKEGVVLTAWSQDNGRHWSDLQPTSLPNPNSGIDAVTLQDGQQLLVYNHIGKKPNQWGGRRSPLNVALSEDGKTWIAALVLEHKAGEYSYPSVIQSADGLVHIVYTWQRKRIKHVVLDPALLKGKTIKEGIWPE